MEARLSSCSPSDRSDINNRMRPIRWACAVRQDIKVPVPWWWTLPLHSKMNWVPLSCPDPSNNNVTTASPPAPVPPDGKPFPSNGNPPVSPPQSELQRGRHAHSLKSRAVQRQGCERGVREVAAARQAEGLQPGAAPADLHHAFVRNALGTQNRKAGQKAQETETWIY